jgi:hypothetical protein
MVLFFLAKYLLNPFTITSAMIPITKPEMNSPTIVGVPLLCDAIQFCTENSPPTNSKAIVP